MKFNVEKFMSMAAVLAGAALAIPACVSDDNDSEGSGATGGSSANGGSAGKAQAGSSGNDSGGSNSSTGGAPDGAGGEAGSAAGGDSTGGTSAGGAGGEGGVGGTTECIPDPDPQGGAGGDPSGEVPPSCLTIATTDCDTVDEGMNPPLDNCYSASAWMRPGLLAALEACLGQIADPCAASAAADTNACRTQIVGRACPSAEATAACTAIRAREGCSGVVESACLGHLEPMQEAGITLVNVNCMDPAGELYDALFAGTCAERLDVCVSSVTFE